MANVTINDLYLTSIANAIRAKNGTSASYKPKQMADAILEIPTTSGDDDNTGGGSVVIDDLGQKLLERSLSGDITLDCTKIGPYGMAGMHNMTTLSSSAKTIETGGCAYNNGVTKITLPQVVKIDAGAFVNCSALTTLDLGNQLVQLATNIAGGCDKLTAIIIRTYSVPNVPSSNPFPQNFWNEYAGTNPGYIYVPQTMIAAYQASGNTILTKQKYRAIEDYPDICG